ncbi:hypothetical protein GWI33_022035 [Rhynchophorus ferrugineus]|uniref:Uncharacterized protein n=1 Tax=Rhynchophorus ferrugineus TaxID=354439 RepID=A0A834MHV3_RHYFE|nr:hypothetical protein GWI33_022035 [Rhynchophorus ferrugineus]
MGRHDNTLFRSADRRKVVGGCGRDAEVRFLFFGSVFGPGPAFSISPVASWKLLPKDKREQITDERSVIGVGLMDDSADYHGG